MYDTQTVYQCPQKVVEHQPGCMYRPPSTSQIRVLINGTPMELWGIEQRLDQIEKLLERLTKQSKKLGERKCTT